MSHSRTYSLADAINVNILMVVMMGKLYMMMVMIGDDGEYDDGEHDNE